MTQVDRHATKMRMSELSRRSGVSVATIKYYVREGLLPAGEPTAVNQALYDDGHLRRIELIRVLREAADLSIATIGRVLTAMDRYRAGDRPDHLSEAVRALSDPIDIADDERDEFAAAEQDVSALLAELGWDVDADSPGRDDLVGALVVIRRHMPGLIVDHHALRSHADAVRGLADVEIPEQYDPASDPADVLRFTVLGTVLFEPVLLALRKLAHVDRIRSLPSTTWTKRTK